MARSWQEVEPARIDLYHDQKLGTSPGCVRFIARVVKGLIDGACILCCPEDEACKQCRQIKCHAHMVEVHGILQHGDLVEVVGVVDDCRDELTCEALIVKSMVGMDFKKYRRSVQMLKTFQSSSVEGSELFSI